jgi:hypothetical protein
MKRSKTDKNRSNILYGKSQVEQDMFGKWRDIQGNGFRFRPYGIQVVVFMRPTAA